MKPALSKLAALVLLASATSTAMAVNYSCVGPVRGVALTPGGSLTAREFGGQQWAYICNVSVTQNDVSPETCRSIFALLLTAQAQNKQVQMWFGDSSSCAARAQTASWAWLTGWYFGPELVD